MSLSCMVAVGGVGGLGFVAALLASQCCERLGRWQGQLGNGRSDCNTFRHRGLCIARRSDAFGFPWDPRGGVERASFAPLKTIRNHEKPMLASEVSSTAFWLKVPLLGKMWIRHARARQCCLPKRLGVSGHQVRGRMHNSSPCLEAAVVNKIFRRFSKTPAASY